jgi:hypothetical protein
MSSTRVLSGTGAGVPSGSGGRKRGRLLGSRNKVKDPAVTPPVPRKRGRPPGSRNKKTVEALAVAATAESAGAAPAAIAAAIAASAVAPPMLPPRPLLERLPPPFSQWLPFRRLMPSSVARPALLPSWCANLGSRHRSNSSPTPRSTGLPISWLICGPDARCACRCRSSSSTP